MKAMVLAAGIGKRLQPATLAVPKPLFPLLGVPLVEWVLAGLRCAGVTDCILNVSHLAGLLVRRLGNGVRLGVRLSYSDEPVILGTGGGLSAVRRYFDGEDRFLLHNGDVFTDWDLGNLLRGHVLAGVSATMALADPPDMPEARLVHVADGRVLGIRGRPATGNGPGYVFSGVSVLGPRIFDYLPVGEVSCLVANGLIPMMEAGHAVGAHLEAGRFCDIGTIERYLRLNWELLPCAREMLASRGFDIPKEVAPGVLAHHGVRIEPGATVHGPVLLGHGSVIQAGAKVGPRAILSPGCVAMAGSVVKDAVVFDGVEIEGQTTGIRLEVPGGWSV